MEPGTRTVDPTCVRLGFFRVRPSTTGRERYGSLLVVNGALEPVELCVTMVRTEHPILWGIADQDERICGALLRDALKNVEARPEVVVAHAEEVPQGALGIGLLAGSEGCRAAPGWVEPTSCSGGEVDSFLLQHGVTVVWYRRVPPPDSPAASMVRSMGISGALFEPLERAWRGLDEAVRAHRS